MVKNLNANTGPYWRMPRSRNPSQSRAIPGQTPRNTSEDGPGGLFLATGLSFVAADAMMDRPRKDIFQRTAAARCCLGTISKRGREKLQGGRRLIFQRRQSPQHLRRRGPMGHALVFAYLSVAKNKHALGELRDVVLVGDQHDGQSFVIQVLENLHDLDRGAAVEISGGLVGQQNRRLVHQRARNGHALLLPTGHLRWKMLRAIRKPNHGQRFGSSLGAFRLRNSRIQRRQFHILERRRSRQQVESLKNKSNLLIANQRQGFLVVLRNVNAFQQVAPGARFVQASQDVHERGLAAAAGAHNGHELAARNFQAHAAQRVHAGLAQFVVLVKIFDLKDALGGWTWRGFDWLHGGSRVHLQNVPCELPLTPQRAGTLRFWPHGADHYIVPRLQFALENRAHFGVRMVRDSNRNLDRLQSVIRMEFPHHRAICFRHSSGTRRSRSASRCAHGFSRIRGLSLASLDPILLVNRKNLFRRHRRLVPQGSVRHLHHVLHRGHRNGDVGRHARKELQVRIREFNDGVVGHHALHHGGIHAYLTDHSAKRILREGVYFERDWLPYFDVAHVGLVGFRVHPHFREVLRNRKNRWRLQ